MSKRNWAIELINQYEVRERVANAVFEVDEKDLNRMLYYLKDQMLGRKKFLQKVGLSEGLDDTYKHLYMILQLLEKLRGLK